MTQKPWTYKEAFCRNLGLIGPGEQETLRGSRVAIAGMGGIGGIDLVTLVRLGVGRFTIADPDRFETANHNRQYGAMISTKGRLKTQVMVEIARDINPDVEIMEYPEAVGRHNASDFFCDVDLFVDAIDFFAVDARRILFREAAARGLYAITAGPVGFGGIWIVFDPKGVTFDEHFRVGEDGNEVAAFIRGISPSGPPSYLDMRYFDPVTRTGPCCSLACSVAAGGMACEAIRILLGRRGLRVAPHIHGFDPYTS